MEDNVLSVVRGALLIEATKNSLNIWFVEFYIVLIYYPA